MKSDPNLAIVVDQTVKRARRGTHATYLTVHSCCSIKADQVENYGQKRHHASKRVNLQRKINPRSWSGAMTKPEKKGNGPILSVGRNDALGRPPTQSKG